MQQLPNPRGVCIQQSTMKEAEILTEISKQEFGSDTADLSTVYRIMKVNSECFFTIRRDQRAGEQTEILGYFAFILLNSKGHTALQTNTFNPGSPHDSMLCPQHQPPAAIYWWSAVAKRTARMALPLVVARLQSERLRGANIFARGATREGATALLNLGFVPIHEGEDPMSGCMMFYQRQPQILAA